MSLSASGSVSAGAAGDSARRRQTFGVGALLLPVLLYAAVVVAMTWPLAAHITSKLPRTHPASDFDTMLVGWALAHQSQSLLSDPTELYHGEVFHPSEYALLHGEAGFGALPLFMPVFALSGDATLALNVTFLGGLALTATALHVVVLWWTGVPVAGFAAAATFLTTPFVLWSWIPIAINYACLFWFPFIIYRAAQPLEDSRGVLTLAALVAVQGAVSHYVAAAVCAPLLALGLWRLVRRKSRREGALLLASLVLSLVALAVIYGPHIAYRAANPDVATRSPWRLATMVSMTKIPRELVRGHSPASVVVPAVILIVVGGSLRLLSRAGSAMTSSQIWSTALFWAVVGYLASLSPTVDFFGERVRLLHSWLADGIPLWRALRAPERVAVASLMGLAIAVGAGAAELVRRLEARLDRAGFPIHRLRAALAIGIAAVWFAAYRMQHVPALRPPLQAGYPLQSSVVSRGMIVDELRNRTGALVELPAPPKNVFGHKRNTRAMFRSLYHDRPVLNGYSGYWPEGYLGRMALARKLPDPAALRELRNTADLKLVLVDLAAMGDSAEKWVSLADTPSGLRLHARDGDLLLFVTTSE